MILDWLVKECLSNEEILGMLQVRNEDGDSPLHVAVKNNSAQTLNILLDVLENESNETRIRLFNQQNKEGDTMLHVVY